MEGGSEPASTSEGIQLDETAGRAMEIEWNHGDAVDGAENQCKAREMKTASEKAVLIVDGQSNAV